MEKVYKRESFSAEETFAIGKELAAQAKPGEVLKEYDEGRMPFYHFDVYRIGSDDEMDEIGYYEAIDGDGVCLIEWAELIYDILPPQYKKVTIKKDVEKGFDYRTVLVEEITR